MKRFALTLAALVALTSPAFGLDYNCSPMTGGCVPRASQPSAFDSPVYYPPRIELRRGGIQDQRVSGPGARRRGGGK